MDKKTLIIFTGGPGTGKSKTAEKFMDFLADDQIVKISYDEIKEKNWDRFGFDDQGEKERLDHWSLEEFYLTLGKRMWEEKTIVVEYPFCQKHKSGFSELLTKYGYCAVTVCLYTDYRTEYERSIVRGSNTSRHPGHLLSTYHKETFHEEILSKMEQPSYEEFVSRIAAKDYNIALGESILLDVTDFSRIDYESVFTRISGL